MDCFLYRDDDIAPEPYSFILGLIERYWPTRMLCSLNAGRLVNVDLQPELSAIKFLSCGAIFQLQSGEDTLSVFKSWQLFFQTAHQ